jgi:hypothetical protein
MARIYSIGAYRDARVNCLNLLAHRIMATNKSPIYFQNTYYVTVMWIACARDPFSPPNAKLAMEEYRFAYL